MIDLNNYESDNWQDALMRMTGKGYRKTKNGTYETFISNHCKTISLGTYSTIDEAEDVLFDYRVNRLLSSISEYCLDIDDAILFMDRYLAFPSGLIFNLHGERMRGGVNRDGYIQGIFNWQNITFHRIIALLFCPRIPGKDFVNHIDGNKQNNSADNLEWVTRSENALHSFSHGLQRTIHGNPVYTQSELEYIKEHCYDNSRDVADVLGRNRESVRKIMYRYRKD